MLVAFGIILVIAGAIVTFAVDAQLENVDLAVVGWILMAGGAASIIAGAVSGASWMSMRKQKFEHERHVSPDGSHVIEETRAS